jgi:hypothetical protein
MQPHRDRYIPAKTNGGWGVAGLVVALAVALSIGAGVIHYKTYKHPTDVTWHAVGSKKAH